MIKRPMINREENPFYGKTALKQLLEMGQTNKVSSRILDSAWKECNNDPTLVSGFFCICFSFGEIPNRNHHIFNEKVSGGGEGNRESFEVFMDWMLDNEGLHEYFYAFLDNDLFRQYTSVWNVLRSGLRTQKGSEKITKTHDFLMKVDIDRLAEYLARVITTAPEAELVSIAKYLSRIRYTRKRNSGKYSSVQKANKDILNRKKEFYVKLSAAMNWDIVAQDSGNVIFKGMNEWKKEHNGDNPSVVFSNKSVLTWDTDQFIAWIDKIPGLSRQRVFSIINKDSEKWILKDGKTMKDAYAQWQTMKENSQKELRRLEQVAATTEISAADQKKLAKAKKASKVNIGSQSIYDLFSKLLSGSVGEKEMNISAQELLGKIDLRVPVMNCIDVSGSMRSMTDRMGIRTQRITIAQLVTTLLMLKNPSKDLADYVIKFHGDAQMFADQSNEITLSTNRFMESRTDYVEGLIDRREPFMENYRRIQGVIQGNGGRTNIEAVSQLFLDWVNDAPSEAERSFRKDQLVNYPVFLFISDNEFNSSYTPLQSIQKTMTNLNSLGWDGIFILWDVDANEQRDSSRFEGMQNVVYLAGSNPSVLSQIFENLHDMEMIDTYTPLNGLYRSNRYNPVRNVVASLLSVKDEITA